MSEGTDTPTNETGAPAPAASETSTTVQESVSQEADAAAVDGTSEQQQSSQDEGSKEAEQPRRRSTTERYRRKLSAQAGVIEQTIAERNEWKRKYEELSGPKRPDPADYPAGEFDPKFVQDSIDFGVNAGFAKRERAQPSIDQGKIAARSAFAQKANAVPGLAAKVARVGDDNSLTQEMADAIADEGDPAVLNYLLDHPDEMDDIAELPPDKMQRAIGKLAAKVSQPRMKVTTQATKPVQPLTGGASKGFDPAKAEMDEFASWLKKDLDRRAGR